MGKRKADEAGLPHTVRQEPAPVAGTGPFVVYFPSRFEPEGDVACEWQAYAHQRKNQYTVVARTVSCGARNARAALQVGQLRPGTLHLPLPPPPPAHLLASPPLQKNQVDFVGSTSSAEYSTQLPCRWVLTFLDAWHGNHKALCACSPACALAACRCYKSRSLKSDGGHPPLARCKNERCKINQSITYWLPRPRSWPRSNLRLCTRPAGAATRWPSAPPAAAAASH